VPFLTKLNVVQNEHFQSILYDIITQAILLYANRFEYIHSFFAMYLPHSLPLNNLYSHSLASVHFQFVKMLYQTFLPLQWYDDFSLLSALLYSLPSFFSSLYHHDLNHWQP